MIKLKILQTLKEGFRVLIENPFLFVIYAFLAIMPNISQELLGLVTNNIIKGIILIIITLFALFLSGIFIRYIYSVKVQKSSLMDIIKFVGRKYFFLLLLAIITSIFISIGYLLLIIPGIFITIKLMFTSHAILIDNDGVINSLKRSWNVTRGNFWRLFVLLLITFVLFFIIILPIFILSVSAFFIPSLNFPPIIFEIVGISLSLFFYPWTMASLTIAYLQLREIKTSSVKQINSKPVSSSIDKKTSIIKSKKPLMPKLNLFNIFRKKKDVDSTDKNLEKLQKEVTKKPKFSVLSIFKKKEKKESRLEYFKNQRKKKSRERAKVLERKHKLRFYLERAGLGITPEILSKRVFNVGVFINLVISGFLIYHFSTTLGITYTTILLSIIALWVLVFTVLLFVLWILFYVVVDLKIFRRKITIEDVLPDFLQLTASNIKSGMTIDRALWFAVRPRFGVLAKEIEIVAKETMRGEDLKTALQKFADKYDSILLKRSISLLIEGLESGGEIGGLLNKIAINIQETKIMKKEMAANVTTYAIFISFATVAAAPALFALSGVLIKVIGSLGSELGGITGSAGIALSFSGGGIEFNDFRIFAVVSLIMTSFFSAAIISTIVKGNMKEGLRYIPIFMIVSVTLFFIADLILGKVIGNFSL